MTAPAGASGQSTGPAGWPAGIEFRDLRDFAAVAEELHFGRAAARLFITQPGLSQAIARLERLLDVRLLTRTRSNVELTEAGAELLDGGRRLLADLEGAVVRVRMAGHGEAGLVRVGVAHLAEPAVAPALTAFQAEHASIVVDRSAMVSERLLEQVAEGCLHAAAAGRRCLDYLRSYRDRHAWISDPDAGSRGHDHGPGQEPDLLILEPSRP
jgi:DNA-binding transcriptional LysR family regulator